MKKYIATVDYRYDRETFKVFFDDETGIFTGTFQTGEVEEIHDMSVYDDEGEKITQFSDKELVEAVYRMYGGGICWEIIDCIEYDE